jgi:hypothetical protein
MLGLRKTGTAGALAPSSSARSQDVYQRYAAVLYRQALLSLDDSAYPRALAALWRAVLRRLATSSAAARDGDQGWDAGHPVRPGVAPP